MPVVESLVYDTPLDSVLAALTIALDGFAIYNNGKTMYYYFDFGKSVGLFLS